MSASGGFGRYADASRIILVLVCNTEAKLWKLHSKHLPCGLLTNPDAEGKRTFAAESGKGFSDNQMLARYRRIWNTHPRAPGIIHNDNNPSEVMSNAETAIIVHCDIC